MTEDKLATMPVGRLLAQMSLPIMVSFFIQALYNFVDSMFVAQLSEQALTATSLAFPMQQISHAIAVGTGIGMAAVIPKLAAKNEMEQANQAAHSGIVLGAIYSLIFLVLGFFVAKPLYHQLTTDPEIAFLGASYLRIVWMVSFGIFFGQCFEKMLMAAGHSMLSMVAQASGALFNMIVDPLLIFGIGPFPKMGIIGAAVATVMGQILAAILAGILNAHYNRWINLSIEKLRLNVELAKEIIVVGFPSIITIGLNAITSFSVNMILMGYSSTATAVYGIWIKLQSFCYMPLFGMNNALIPILSFNHARKENQRVTRVTKLALRSALVAMVTIGIVLEIIPNHILALFNPSNNLLLIGQRALKICLLSLPFAAVAIIRSASMQALEYSFYTLVVNVLRQFVLLAGLFLTFSLIFHDVNHLWWAVVLTELISAFIAEFLYRKMQREWDR